MKKEAFLLLGTLFIVQAGSRPATDNDVASYVDDYTSAAEDDLETCSAFSSAREQKKCLADHYSRWDKSWHDEHLLEWGRNKTVKLKQRLFDFNRAVQTRLQEINEEREKDNASQPDDEAVPYGPPK